MYFSTVNVYLMGKNVYFLKYQSKVRSRLFLNLLFYKQRGHFFSILYSAKTQLLEHVGAFEMLCFADKIMNDLIFTVGF